MDTPTPAFLRPFEIRESAHRIHDPLSEEKLATLGRALRLESGDRLLDLAARVEAIFNGDSNGGH